MHVELPSLQTLLWPRNDLPWPITFIPGACRLGAIALLIPVALLLAVDVAAYLYFRICHQPWLTRQRTAYWTFQRPTWRGSGSKSSSPVLSTPATAPSSPTQRSKPLTNDDDTPKPPRRNRSWVHARARSVGVDGPLIGFEQLRSPSPESATLPPLSDEEEVDEAASGHTSEEWVKTSGTE